METRKKKPDYAQNNNPSGVRMTEKEKYVQFLKKRLYYKDLPFMDEYKNDMDTIDGIINMIADIASTVPQDNIEWINSRAYDHEVVKAHLLK